MENDCLHLSGKGVCLLDCLPRVASVCLCKYKTDFSAARRCRYYERPDYITDEETAHLFGEDNDGGLG